MAAVRRLVWIVRWTLLGAASGVLAGLACSAFFSGLRWATDTRIDHGWLLWLLPVAGLAIGSAYHFFGGRAALGSGLLIDEIHQPTDWVPRRMAPMIAIGTVVSHLFGASVGREGSALQMSGSLSDWLSRVLHLEGRDRRTLLIVALSAGFAGMFGVPLAGAIFGLEVQAVRPSRREMLRRTRQVARTRSFGPVQAPAEPIADLRARVSDSLGRWRGLAATALPAAVGAFVSDRLVRVVGHHSESANSVHVALPGSIWPRLVLAGVAFGLMSIAFVESTDLVHRWMARYVARPPLRPVVGAFIVLAGVAVVGRNYLGLSLPLVEHALVGQDSTWTVPMLKLAFTAVCLGSGFVGGEVTPLFIIGATLGAAVSGPLGIDPLLGAAVGYVSVFAAAANTPIACAVMAVEVFGWGVAGPAVLVCVVAWSAGSHRGIYPTQRVRTTDGFIRRSDLPSRFGPAGGH